MLRRTSLALMVATMAIGSGGLATSAQSIDMATHPYVGSWMCQIPGSSFGRGTISVHADGTTLGTGPLTSVGPDGKVALTSPSVGTWQPTGPRTAHGTSVFYFSDLAGAYTGSLTFDGSDTVNADGMSTYEEPGATVTIPRRAGQHHRGHARWRRGRGLRPHRCRGAGLPRHVARTRGSSVQHTLSHIPLAQGRTRGCLGPVPVGGRLACRPREAVRPRWRNPQPVVADDLSSAICGSTADGRVLWRVPRTERQHDEG